MSTGKKEKVLNTTNRKTPILTIAIAVAALVGALALFLIEPGMKGAGSTNPAGYEQKDGYLYIPVSGGEAQFFQYTFDNGSGATDINFFVLESSDGVMRAAFDACDVCFRAQKGYRQDGDVMVCNNCGQRFDSVLINVEKGGCNPSPLKRRVDGDYVVIAEADIQTGAVYF